MFVSELMCGLVLRTDVGCLMEVLTPQTDRGEENEEARGEKYHLRRGRNIRVHDGHQFSGCRIDTCIIPINSLLDDETKHVPSSIHNLLIDECHVLSS